MRAGDLRHEVTMRAPIGVLHETEPVDVDPLVYMQIEALPLAFQQREQLAVGGLNTSTIYTLTCRYRTDVRPAYVFVERCCTQRTFQILAIIPRARRDALDLTCVTAG
jgi:hypothetical protein